MTIAAAPNRPRTFAETFARMNWTLITVTCVIAFIGVMMQYSVAESGTTREPTIHGLRFFGLLAVVLCLAMLDLRIWFGVAYPLYALALALILAVEIPGLGFTAGGATLWLKIGPVQFQPSELMKLAVVLALARYYQKLDPKLLAGGGYRRALSVWSWSWRELLITLRDLRVLFVPLVLIGLPVVLVAAQPDLGTAVLIGLGGAAVMFLAGLRKRFMIAAACAAVVGGVFAYQFVLEDYQRTRIDVFLGLEEDPQGGGYNINQAKIAVGSAGWFGHGYMEGPQSQGNFVPEKHTDFIFAMIVEEFGFLGGAAVLILYAFLLSVCVQIARRARSLFGKLAAGGVTATIAAYVLINTAMVLGLFPVVGIPLPLISYGGTSMLTTMLGLAVVLAVDLRREQTGGRGLLW